MRGPGTYRDRSRNVIVATGSVEAQLPIEGADLPGVIGSEEAARGLDIARGLITDGIAPPEVVDFREAEALNAFMAGEAVFLRSWPYAYGVLRQAGFTEERVIVPYRYGFTLG